MKSFCNRIQTFLFVVLLFPVIGFSQTQTSRTTMGNPIYNSGNEFNIYQKAGGGGLDALGTGSSGDVKGSQFFLSDWSNGEVVTERKEVYGEDLQLVYDKVRQELFVRKKDSAPILLANKDEIESFSLTDANKGKYKFVNSKLFSDDRPEVFYQVLVYDSTKLSLLKYIKTTFVRGNPNDMMKQNQGAVYDEFVDKPIYYLAKGKNEFQTIQLKSKSIKKALEKLHINNVEGYFNNHPETQDEKYLIEMVKAFNL